MLGQSKTRLPGRDRRRLRADRLLADQRPLRPADPRASSRRSTPRASGTAPTTGRSRASSTRSRPFNFTAIAGNLPTAPALMGNTVVWKPSPTQQLAAQLTMELLEAAGLPPGVINLVTGDGLNVSKVALADPDLAGIHFTGSTPTFQHLWQRGRRQPRRATAATRGSSARPAARTSSWPTRSADPDVLRTAMIRGAFEYQGQKCSAASRAYVPRSLWKQIRADLVDITDGLHAGRRHRPVELHGRRHRRARVRQARRGDRPRPRDGRGQGDRRWHVRRQRGLLRPPDRPGDRRRRPTSRSAPSTSGRSCRSTSTRTASTTGSWTRWSRSRPTA